MLISEYGFELFRPQSALSIEFVLECLKVWKYCYLKRESRSNDERMNYRKIAKFDNYVTVSSCCGKLITKYDLQVFYSTIENFLICKPVLFYTCCKKFYLCEWEKSLATNVSIRTQQRQLKRKILTEEMQTTWMKIVKMFPEFDCRVNCYDSPLVVRTDVNYGFYQNNSKLLNKINSKYVVLPNPIYWQLNSVFFYEKLLKKLSYLSDQLRNGRYTNKIVNNILKKQKREFLTTNLYYCDLNTRHQGNSSIYRLNAIGKRSKFTGRGMIVPEPSLKPNEIVLPRCMWIKLNRPEWVIINRMPTLLPENFTAHRVDRVWQHSCIGIPCEILEGHNGDFDGDEINLWPVDNIDSVAELAFVMNPRYNMRSFTMSNCLKLEVNTDCVLAVYYATTKCRGHRPGSNWISNLFANMLHKMPNRIKPWFFNSTELDVFTEKNLNEYYAINPYPSFNLASFESDPTGAAYYTRCRMNIDNNRIDLNRCLRKCFPKMMVCKMNFYEIGEKSISVTDNHKQFLSEIMRTVYEMYNSEICFQTFCNLKHFYTQVAEIISFSISTDELDSLHNMPWQPDVNITSSYIEKQFKSIANKIENDFLISQAICGVKGTYFHLYQLTHALGSQTTIFAEPNKYLTDVSMTESFYSGLTPSQYILHTQAGTDDLLVTFMEISRPGYMTYKLTNSLQNCIVGYDHKIYKNDKIIFDSPIDYVHPSKLLSPTTIETVLEYVRYRRKRKHINSRNSRHTNWGVGDNTIKGRKMKKFYY